MAPLPVMKCYGTLPLICAIWFICAGPSLAQETIKPPFVDTFRPLSEWLASPALEGRETGTYREALAARSREAYKQSAIALLVIPEDYFSLVAERKVFDSYFELVNLILKNNSLACCQSFSYSIDHFIPFKSRPYIGFVSPTIHMRCNA